MPIATNFKPMNPGGCHGCNPCLLAFTVNVTYSDGRLIESIVTITQGGVRVARSVTSAGHFTATIPGNSTNLITVETCGYGTSTSTVSVLCAPYTLAVTVSLDGSYSDATNGFESWWLPNTLHESDALGSCVLTLDPTIAQYTGSHAAPCGYGTPTQFTFRIYYDSTIPSFVLLLTFGVGDISNPDYTPCVVSGGRNAGSIARFGIPCPWVRSFAFPHDFGYFANATPPLGTVTLIS